MDNTGKNGSKSESKNRSRDGARNKDRDKDKEYDGYDLLCASPTRLTFYAPYDRVQKRTVILTNTFPQPMLFKMKSNASKYYQVSPFAGWVEPHSSLEVKIRLNGFDFTPENPYIHHFSVYSTISPCNGLQRSSKSILAVFKEVPSRKLGIVRIDVEYDTNPPKTAAKPLLDAAAFGLRNAAERLMVNQAVSSVTQFSKVTDYTQRNDKSAANQSVDANGTPTTLEAQPFNFHTNFSISLGDIPAVFQYIVLGGAVLGALYITMRDTEKLDVCLNTLAGNMDTLNTPVNTKPQ